MIVGGIPMLFTALTVVPVDISLTDNAVITTDLTTYTFSARALGVAESTRRIAVGITSNISTNGRTISSVTIGGVSASEVVFARSDNGPASTLAAIWMAEVPTGTTGDVVVTFSAAMGYCTIDIYRLLNASATAYHTATDITATANALSESLNLIANGAAIGVFINGGTTAVRTTTWTNITEQTDRSLTEFNLSASTAANTTATTQTLTISATASGTIDRFALALASFQPV
jgi:hypothetical protein